MQKTSEIEFLICDVGLLWRRLYSKYAEQLNLIGVDRRIIIILSRMPGITQVKLAEELESEPQALTRVLDRLEKKKWIKKETPKSDRRAKCLSLTAKGETIMKNITKIGDQLRPKITEGLSKKSLQEMINHLEKIKKNLSKELL